MSLHIADFFNNGNIWNILELSPSYGSHPLNCSFSQYNFNFIKELLIITIIAVYKKRTDMKNCLSLLKLYITV